MYDIYYAHHRWKYHTQEEVYELEVIRRYFPNAKIFNPSTDIEMRIAAYEELVMQECLKAVDSSDIVIFSSLDGTVGSGVYKEVEYAIDSGKLVFYLYQDTLYSAFHLYKRDEASRSDRLYAFVDAEGGSIK